MMMCEYIHYKRYSEIVVDNIGINHNLYNYQAVGLLLFIWQSNLEKEFTKNCIDFFYFLIVNRKYYSVTYTLCDTK